MTSTVEGEEAAPARRHVLQELGWDVGPSEEADGLMLGSAVVVPEMHAPGTAHLRTSILAAWADVRGRLPCRRDGGPACPRHARAGRAPVPAGAGCGPWCAARAR